MGKDFKFKSAEDLYKRVLPALRSKTDEFKKEHINYINERDIWNYLSVTLWRGKKDLEFYELVDSIINVNAVEVSDYLIKNAKKDELEGIL